MGKTLLIILVRVTLRIGISSRVVRERLEADFLVRGIGVRSCADFKASLEV